MLPRCQYLALLASLALTGLPDSHASSSYDNSGAAQQPDITAFAFVRKTASETSNDPYSNVNNNGNNPPSRQTDESSTEQSVVSSSLLYDGGCVVSAEAIMCAGGDDSAFFSLMDYGGDEYDDEEESDDDDDDDDDGHSSMLSNASLRRAKVGAGYSAPPPSSTTSREPQSTKHSDDSQESVTPSWSKLSFTQETRIPFLRQSTNNNIEALAIRGGASAGVSNLGSEFAKKLLVTALVTLVYEAMIGHMLEFIKIYMQTSPDGISYGQVIQQITAEKGIGGLWDGFIPWGVVQSIFKGSVFGLAHAMASSCLIPVAEEGKMPMQLALTVAGGIAGGVQGYVLSPTLLLKTRVMTNPVFREKMSLVKTTWLSATIGVDVVASEGVGALMKGSTVFATKRVFDWATRYYFSDLFESLAVSYKGGTALTIGEKIGCSLLGGTASTFCTLPLDVLVAKIQDAKKAGVSVSAWKLFRNELEEKGWAGLQKSYMKGFEARLAHVAFTTVAIKTCTPLAYNLIFPAPVAKAAS